MSFVIAVLIGALAFLVALAWGVLSRRRSRRGRPSFKRSGVSALGIGEGLVHALISDRGFLRHDTAIHAVHDHDVEIVRDGAAGRFVLHAVEGIDRVADLSDFAMSARRFDGRKNATLVLIGNDAAFGREALSLVGNTRALHVSDSGVVTERGRGFGSAAPRLVIDNALDRMAADLDAGGLPVISRETARSLVTASAYRPPPVRPSRLRGVVTTALTLAMALCFAIQVIITPDSLRGDGAALSVVYRMGGIHQAAVLEGQWQRLLAAPFLHFGLLHLGVNSWAQWSLGGPIEFLIGPWRFLMLWGLSGLGASVTSLVFNETSVSAGASGAIFGLLGAFTTFVFFRKDVLPQPVPSSLRNGVLATLLLNAMISFMPSIDMAAHAGGFVTGALLALPMVRRRDGPSPSAASLRLAVAALVASGVGLTSYLEDAPRTLRAPEIDGVRHIGDLIVALPRGFKVSETRRDGTTIIDADGTPRSPYAVTYRVSEVQPSEEEARRLLPDFSPKSGPAEPSDWIALSRAGISGNRAIEILVETPASCRAEAERLGSTLAKRIR